MTFINCFSVDLERETERERGTNHRSSSSLSLFALALILWSRRESNPRPNTFCKRFLHAYFLIACREDAGQERTYIFLSWISLLSASQPVQTAVCILW